MNPVQELLKNKQKEKVPTLRAGQVIRVYEKIKEEDLSKGSTSKGGQAGQTKERIQVFEGLVIAVKHGQGLDGTFTVRKIAKGGFGVERIYPLHMPAIEKIEVLRQERVRRAKLYYVRDQVGKKTKKRKTKLENLIFDMGGYKEELTEEGSEEKAQDLGGAEQATQKRNDKKQKETMGREGVKKIGDAEETTQKRDDEKQKETTDKEDVKEVEEEKIETKIQKKKIKVDKKSKVGSDDPEEIKDEIVRSKQVVKKEIKSEDIQDKKSEQVSQKKKSFFSRFSKREKRG